MTLSYILIYCCQVYSSFIIILGTTDATHLGISYFFLSVSNMLQIVMQFYFISELKRVRLYFEAKSPLELDVQLRSFRCFLATASVMLGISAAGTVVILLLDVDGLFKSRNAAKLLSNFFFALIIITILVWQSSSQYFYFIRRRIR